MEKYSRWGCDQRLKDSRDGTNLSFERDRAYGFSWPQRNYRCSFCTKEFKSAQALGGHMNVHRRDRARMRQLSPSWDFPNPNPNPNFNPNPNLSLSSPLPSTPRFLPCNVACLSAISSSPPSLQEDEFGGDGGSCKGMALCREDLGNESDGAMLEFTNFARRNDVIRLDLSLGLIQDEKVELGSDLDLDLELRLGCNS